MNRKVRTRSGIYQMGLKCVVKEDAVVVVPEVELGPRHPIHMRHLEGAVARLVAPFVRSAGPRGAVGAERVSFRNTK